MKTNGWKIEKSYDADNNEYISIRGEEGEYVATSVWDEATAQMIIDAVNRLAPAAKEDGIPEKLCHICRETRDRCTDNEYCPGAGLWPKLKPVASLQEPEGEPGDLKDAALAIFIAERMKIAAEWNIDTHAYISPATIEGIDAEANERFRVELIQCRAELRKLRSQEGK